MVNLSVERMNERSPYILIPSKRLGYMLSAHIVDEEGNDNYTALFLRIDNPDFEDIATEFHHTVRLFSQKPSAE